MRSGPVLGPLTSSAICGDIAAVYLGGHPDLFFCGEGWDRTVETGHRSYCRDINTLNSSVSYRFYLVCWGGHGVRSKSEFGSVVMEAG